MGIRMIIELIIITIAICLHEIGHIIAGWILKIKMKVKLTWYAFLVEVHPKTRWIEFAGMTYAGILAGLPILIWFKDKSLIYIYLFMCIIDMMILLQFFTQGKDKMKKTIIEVMEINYMKCKEEEKEEW